VGEGDGRWRRLNESSVHYLSPNVCCHVGGKYHKTDIFLFLLFLISGHHIAITVITLRYKYLPLPLLGGLQMFLVSAPFSNTSLYETSTYKTDRRKFC
jgi:hypothetical protein